MLAATSFAAVLGSFDASISSADLRSGNAAIANIKASWSQALSIAGDKKVQLTADYDRSESENSLKSISLSGDASDDGLAVSYDVEHNFKSGDTEVSLSAVSSDITLGVELDGSDVTEFSAQRELDLGSTVDTKVTWLVKAATARVKMMTALGDATVSAQVDVKDGETSNLEVGYEANLKKGRDLSVSYNDKELEFEVVDTNFERDATWTATATMQHPELNLEDLALNLKRSWSW